MKAECSTGATCSLDTSTPDIGWIDGFVESIREHVFAREADSLLILLPNQAYKLNHTGIALLSRTLAGEPIRSVLESKKPGMADEPAVVQDVHHFFCDLRALVMGCMGEGQDRRAVETIAYEVPFNTLPVLSEVALTYRCNLSCKFCYAGCRCTRRASKEMTTDEIKRVLDVIHRDAQVPSVSWTGGEPTMRDDLVELTGYACSIGLRVNLITNGTLLNETLVTQLKDAGLKSAQVSLEAPDAATHDAITQVSGSYERTLNGIRLLKDAGLHVHTNTTINQLNVDRVIDMPKLAAELGLQRLSMNMVIPCGSATDAGVSVAYADIGAVVERLRKEARQVGVQFMWYSPTPYCIYNPVASGLGGKSCAACDGLLSVSPTGDVFPCSSVTKSVGNLLKTPFAKVWNSRKAMYWRDKRFMHKLCQGCDHSQICSGGCPIYWDAIGYSELIHAAKGAKAA